MSKIEFNCSIFTALHKTLMAEHCLDQIIRFGDMLNGDTTADRSEKVLIAQLSYNLRGYIDIIGGDGRAKWQELEKCILTDNYAVIVDYAKVEKRKLSD